jgi:hypothetical protein
MLLTAQPARLLCNYSETLSISPNAAYSIVQCIVTSTSLHGIHSIAFFFTQNNLISLNAAVDLYTYMYNCIQYVYFVNTLMFIILTSYFLYCRIEMKLVNF